MNITNGGFLAGLGDDRGGLALSESARIALGHCALNLAEQVLRYGSRPTIPGYAVE